MFRWLSRYVKQINILGVVLPFELFVLAQLLVPRLPQCGRAILGESFDHVVFVVNDEEEAEVQAGWWIWVARKDLKAALEALGLRIPW